MNNPTLPIGEDIDKALREYRPNRYSRCHETRCRDRIGVIRTAVEYHPRMQDVLQDDFEAMHL